MAHTDLTLQLAFQAAHAVWKATGRPSSLMRRAVASARWDYRMTYKETLECLERATGKSIDPADFDNMMASIDAGEE